VQGKNIGRCLRCWGCRDGLTVGDQRLDRSRLRARASPRKAAALAIKDGSSWATSAAEEASASQMRRFNLRWLAVARAAEQTRHPAQQTVPRMTDDEWDRVISGFDINAAPSGSHAPSSGMVKKKGWGPPRQLCRHERRPGHAPRAGVRRQRTACGGLSKALAMSSGFPGHHDQHDLARPAIAPDTEEKEPTDEARARRWRVPIGPLRHDP